MPDGPSTHCLLTRRSPRRGQRFLAVTLASAVALTSFPPPSAWATPRSSKGLLPAQPTLTDLARLDLASFAIPERLGHIIERWQPPDRQPSALVIHLQDLHATEPVQATLSELIGHLNERDGVSLVALEGAEGPVDTTIFSGFPDQATNRKLATLFLKHGLFTGAEHYAVTHPGTVTLWGVEDERLYLDHLAVYQRTAPQRTQTDQALATLRDAVEALKATLYSQPLKALEQRSRAFEDDTLSWSDYLRFLERQARAQRIRLRDYPNLSRMTRLITLESQIDDALVEQETSAFLRDLGPRLSGRQWRELAQLTEAFRSGALPAAGYYHALYQIAKPSGIPLGSLSRSPYPHLTRALHVALLSKRLDHQAFSRELRQLESAVRERLLKTESQRQVARLSHMVRLLDGLHHIKLSHEELEEFHAHRRDFVPQVFESFFNAHQSRLTRRVSLAALRQAAATVLGDLAAQERFYELTPKRDAAFVERTQQAMARHHQEAAVLIAGGFHTQGLTERFREQGIAYVVIAPNIEGQLDEVRYHSLLTGRVPSLDTLWHDVRSMLIPGVLSEKVKINLDGWRKGSGDPQAVGATKDTSEEGPSFRELKVILYTALWLSLKQAAGVTLSEAWEALVGAVGRITQYLRPSTEGGTFTLHALAAPIALTFAGAPHLTYHGPEELQALAPLVAQATPVSAIEAGAAQGGSLFQPFLDAVQAHPELALALVGGVLLVAGALALRWWLRRGQQAPAPDSEWPTPSETGTLTAIFRAWRGVFRRESTTVISIQPPLSGPDFNIYFRRRRVGTLRYRIEHGFLKLDALDVEREFRGQGIELAVIQWLLKRTQQLAGSRSFIVLVQAVTDQELLNMFLTNDLVEDMAISGVVDHDYISLTAEEWRQRYRGRFPNDLHVNLRGKLKADIPASSLSVQAVDRPGVLPSRQPHLEFVRRAAPALLEFLDVQPVSLRDEIMENVMRNFRIGTSRAISRRDLAHAHYDRGWKQIVVGKHLNRRVTEHHPGELGELATAFGAVFAHETVHLLQDLYAFGFSSQDWFWKAETIPYAVGLYLFALGQGPEVKHAVRAFRKTQYATGTRVEAFLMGYSHASPEIVNGNTIRELLQGIADSYGEEWQAIAGSLIAGVAYARYVKSGRWAEGRDLIRSWITPPRMGWASSRTPGPVGSTPHGPTVTGSEGPGADQPAPEGGQTTTGPEEPGTTQESPSITQKPLSSTVTPEAIWRQIEDRGLEAFPLFPPEQVAALAGALTLGAQAQDARFRQAFGQKEQVEFRGQTQGLFDLAVAAMQVLLRGEESIGTILAQVQAAYQQAYPDQARARAPPEVSGIVVHAIPQDAPLTDPTTGLPIPATAFIEGAVLHVFLEEVIDPTDAEAVKAQAVAAFHELYEHLILPLDPTVQPHQRHTRATLAETAFGDGLVTPRVRAQLATLVARDPAQGVTLADFLAQYERVVQEIRQVKFPVDPTAPDLLPEARQAYALAHAEALHAAAQILAPTHPDVRLQDLTPVAGEVASAITHLERAIAEAREEETSVVDQMMDRLLEEREQLERLTPDNVFLLEATDPFGRAAKLLLIWGKAEREGYRAAFRVPLLVMYEGAVYSVYSKSAESQGTPEPFRITKLYAAKEVTDAPYWRLDRAALSPERQRMVDLLKEKIGAWVESGVLLKHVTVALLGLGFSVGADDVSREYLSRLCAENAVLRHLSGLPELQGIKLGIDAMLVKGGLSTWAGLHDEEDDVVFITPQRIEQVMRKARSLRPAYHTVIHQYQFDLDEVMIHEVAHSILDTMARINPDRRDAIIAFLRRHVPTYTQLPSRVPEDDLFAYTIDAIGTGRFIIPFINVSITREMLEGLVEFGILPPSVIEDFALPQERGARATVPGTPGIGTTPMGKVPGFEETGSDQPAPEGGQAQSSPGELAGEEGRCVTGDTWLAVVRESEGGGWRIEGLQIKDVRGGEEVLSLDETTGRIVPRRILGLLPMGTKPVYRLTAASGRSIKTTGNHPYLTPQGWRQVRELRVGEAVAVSSAVDLVAPAHRGDNHSPLRWLNDHAVIGDAEAIELAPPSHQRLGELERLRGAQEKLELLGDLALDRDGQLAELPFGMGGPVIGGHASRRFLTAAAGTRPETREALSDLTKAGLKDSMSSMVRSKASTTALGRDQWSDSATSRKSSRLRSGSSGSSGLLSPPRNAFGFQQTPRGFSRAARKVTSSSVSSSFGSAARRILATDRYDRSSSSVAMPPPSAHLPALLSSIAHHAVVEDHDEGAARFRSGRSIRTTANHPYLTRKDWRPVSRLRVGEEIAVAKAPRFERSGIQRARRAYSGTRIEPARPSAISPLHCSGDRCASSPMTASTMSSAYGGWLRMWTMVKRVGGYSALSVKSLSSVMRMRPSATAWAATAGSGVEGMARTASWLAAVNARSSLTGTSSSSRHLMSPSWQDAPSGGTLGAWRIRPQSAGPRGHAPGSAPDSSRDPRWQRAERRLPAAQAPRTPEPGFLGSTASHAGSVDGPGYTARQWHPSLLPATSKDHTPSRGGQAPAPALSLAPTTLTTSEEPYDPDMIWDPIIAIEAVGTALVYDIEVEGTHNFLANGLLAHNSNLTPPPSSADPAGLSGLHDPGASGNQVPPISQFLSEEARTLLAPAYEEFSASLAAHQEFTEHPLPPLTFSSLTEGEAVSLGPDPERPASFIMDLAQVGRDGERLRQLWWEAVWQWARRQSLRAQEQFLSRNPMLVDEERFEMVMQSKRTFFHRVGIRPKDTVLDLGVGWAENAIPLAELGARVVGIDHSKRMLEFARDNLEQAGVLDRVQLLQGDVLWPPVGAEAFDDVLLQQVALHLLPRFRPRLIQGMARALKPGGAAIILETVRPDGADRGTGDLWTAADWREHLAAAGLSEIRAIPSGDATFMILVARRPQTPPTSAANQSNQEQAQSAQPQQGESSAPAPRPSDMSRREFLKAVSGAVAAACVGAGCATVPEDRAGVPPARHPQTFAESVEAFFNDPRVVSAWHVPAKELFDPVEIFSRRSPHETRLLPLHVLAKEFVTWNTLHPLARVSRIKGEYEQETGERLSEALLLKLVEFEQLTGASSSDRRRVLEAYKALQDALGKSRRAQGFLRVDLEFGMDVGFRSHLRWQVRELVNPAIRKTLPPALAEALDVAHQFLSQTKPWNPSVTGALDTIAQLLAQPSLRREVLRTYEQFVGSERERFVDLASAWLSPQQVKETERWLTTHDVRVFQVGWLKDMPRDHPLLLTYLAAVRAACESAGIPPVRYRGVELLVESSQISYVPGDDLLTLRFETLISNMALSGRLVSGLTGDPSQGLWHLLRKTIVHEISHRWDYRQLPPDVRGAFHRVSWLGPYSLRPDAHLATDFVFGDDEIAKTRDDVERVEDLAEIIEALTDSLPARFEVSRAIDHLLTGRPHLANKIAFAYSFWGRIPDPALPWIVRTDGALPDQLHGAYVFQDARGKRFEVRLRPDGRIERLREVIEPFDPNVFVWQTPEPPNRLKSSGNNFENNPVTAAVLARLVTGKAPDAGSTGSLEREAAQSAVPPEGVVVNAEQPNERHLTREEALRGIDAGRLATVRLPNGSVRWLFTIAGGSGRNDDQEEAQPTEEDTSPLRKKVQEALKRVDGRISVEQMAAAMGERRAALAGLRFHLIVVEENSRRKREEPSRRLLSQRSYNPATTILHALKLMDGEVMERQVAELTGLAAAVVRRRGKWPYVLSVENLRRRREEPARHLLRAYMTKEEVLAVLERCGWKMEQARRETGFGSFGEWYEFLERKGAMPELRARLIEQLNLRDWVIRRVARNFEETALVIDGLMGRLGIKRSEVSKESILEILERHDWNLGEAASELHLGDNERLEDFFNRHALFSEFWLKLRERLEAERWVMRTVARRFGVGEKRIKDLSKRLYLLLPV